MIDRLIDVELKKIETQKKWNQIEQRIIIILTLALLFIFVVSYISNIPYIQIMMLYLSVLILILLFKNITYTKTNHKFEKIAKLIKDKFKDN